MSADPEMDEGMRAVYAFATAFSTWPLTVISRTMPAATVLPMSRKANLPSSGNSLNVSRTTGLSGVIFTIAESPVLIVLGFSSVG